MALGTLISGSCAVARVSIHLISTCSIVHAWIRCAFVNVGLASSSSKPRKAVTLKASHSVDAGSLLFVAVVRRGGRCAFIDVVIAQSSFVARVIMANALERVDAIDAFAVVGTGIGSAIVNVRLTSTTSESSQAITHVRSVRVFARSLILGTVVFEVLTFVDVDFTKVSLILIGASTNEVSSVFVDVTRSSVLTVDVVCHTLVRL